MNRTELLNIFNSAFPLLAKYLDEVEENRREVWRRMNAYINSTPLLPIVPVREYKYLFIYQKFDTLKPLFEKYKNRIILAGGAVVNVIIGRPAPDYDLFIIGDENEFFTIKDEIANLLGDYRENLYVCTFGTIQVIKKIYNSINEILSNFDLPASKLAMDLSTGIIYGTPDGLYSNAVLEIGTNYMVNGRALLHRYKKYTKYKGFKIIKADVKSNAIKDIINGINISKINIHGSYYDNGYSNLYCAYYEKIHYIYVDMPHYRDPIDNESLEAVARELKIDKSELKKKYDKYLFKIIKSITGRYIENAPLKRLASNNAKQLNHPDEFYGAGEGIEHIQCGYKKALMIIDEIFALLLCMKRHKLYLPKYLKLLIWEFV